MKILLKSALAAGCIGLALVLYLAINEHHSRLVSYWYQDWQRTTQNLSSNYTLFLGSSSITRLPSNMLGNCKPFIKYGFNNGTTEHVSAYLAFASLQNVGKVVMYIGENDIARGEAAVVTAGQVINMVDEIRSKTDVPIALVKIKYSPIRQAFHSGFFEFNELMVDRYGTADEVSSRNVTLLPLDSLRASNLYVSDGVHLNPLGYARFTQFINEFCREGD